MARKTDVKLIIGIKNDTQKTLKAIEGTVKRFSSGMRKSLAEAGGGQNPLARLLAGVKQLDKAVGGGILEPITAANNKMAVAVKKATAALEAEHTALAKINADQAAAVVNTRKNTREHERLAQAIKKEEAALRGLQRSEKRLVKGSPLRKGRKDDIRNKNKDIRKLQNEQSSYTTALAKSASDELGFAASLDKSNQKILEKEAALRRAKSEMASTKAAAADLQRSLKVAQRQLQKTFAPDLAVRKFVFDKVNADLKATQAGLERVKAKIENTKNPSRRLLRNFDRSRLAVRFLREELSKASAEYGRLASVVNRPVRDVNELHGRVQSATDIVESNPRLKAPADELRNPTAPTTAYARAQDRLARSLGVATGKQLSFNDALRKFYGNRRVPLNFLQRMTSEFIGLAAASVGAFAAFRAISGVLKAIKQVELSQNRLRVVVGDDQGAIAGEMDFLRRTAERLGVQFGILANEYTKFSIATKGTILQGQATRDIFTAVSEAGRVNGLSNENLKGTYLALTQMVSKGRVQMEELKRQLGDHLPGAVQIFASALKITVSELIKVIEAGDLSSDKLIEFAKELNKRFGPSLAKSLKTTQAELGKFQNVLFQMSLRVGRGGFIEAFNNLLATMTQTFQSAQFTSFLDRVSSGLASLTNALSFVVEHFDLFLQVLLAFAGFKLSVFVALLAGKIWRLGAAFVALLGVMIALPGAFKRGEIGAKAAGYQMDLFATKVSRTTRVLNVLKVAAATTFPLLLALGGAYLAQIITKTKDANAILEVHRRLVDSVKNAYDDGGADSKGFISAIDAISPDVAKQNANDMADLLVGKERALSKLISDRLSSEVSSAIGDPKLASALSKIQDKLPAFFANVRGAETPSAKSFIFDRFLGQIGTAEGGLLAGAGKSGEDLLGDLLPLLGSLTEGSTDFIDAMVLMEAAVNGNVEPLNRWLTRLDDVGLLILKTEQKLEGFYDSTKKIGDPASESVAKLEKNLKTLEDNAAESVREFKILQDALVDTKQFKKFRAALKEQNEHLLLGAAAMADMRKEIAFEKIFEGAVPGVSGHALQALGGADANFDNAAGLAKISTARKSLEAEILRFDKLPTKIQATLIKLQAVGTLPQATIQALQNGASFAEFQATLPLSGIDGGIANYLNNNAVKSAFAAFNVGGAEATHDQGDHEDKLLADQNQTIDNLQKIKAGAERQAFIEAAIYSERESALARGVEFTAKAENLYRILKGREFDLNQTAPEANTNKGKTPKEKADEARQHLEALISLRDAQRDLFAVERGNVIAGGGNSETDIGLNKRRDGIATLGDEIGLAHKKVVAMFKALKNQSPEVQQILAELGIQFKDLQIEAGKVKDSILTWEEADPILKDSLVSGFETFVEKIHDGVRGFELLKFAFNDFAANFLNKIGDIFFDLAAQEIVNKIGGLLGLLSSGGTSALAGFSPSSSFGGGSGYGYPFHTGGKVSTAGRRRSISDMSIFANAPRLHNGGSILGKNEVPAILEKGEMVIAKDNVAKAFGASGGAGLSGGLNVEVINMVDSGEIASKGNQTKTGVESIMNVIAGNAKTVKALLG